MLRSQVAGFLRRCDGIIESACLCIGSREGANEGWHAVATQCTSFLGKLDGFTTIAQRIVCGSGEKPREVAQSLRKLRLQLDGQPIVSERARMVSQIV